MPRFNIGLFTILLLWGAYGIAEPLHIRVLDVGEGQAILLHQNHHAVLIDTGHAGKARSVVRRMNELDIKVLDYLFLTHLHPDHASGYFRVAEEFTQLKLRDNCYPVENTLTPDMMRWVDQALKLSTLRKCIKSGDRIEWEASIIRVLWPIQKPAKGADVNHTSLVLEITHQGRKLLIMGDAGQQAELEMLRNNALEPVDILIVGHHGYQDASSQPFLEVIKPEKSVISINKNNFRGYPSPEVVKRLKLNGSEVYSTYEHGELHFVFEE